MQQHSVPQNVTQYQFRLVGDMTLKQFLELAGGLVLAYLFYASNLIFIFKWPLALLSLFLGIGLAFFPIEERPLDVWIINFLKSIYAPTRFIWQKTTKLPALFTFTPHEVIEKVTATKTVKAPPISTPQAPKSDLSKDEVAKIKELDGILSSLEKSTPAPKQPPKLTNKPTVEVRKLNPQKLVFDATNNPRPTPPKKPTPSPSSKAQTPSNVLSSPKDEVGQPPAKPITTSQASPTSQNIFISNPSVHKQAIETSGTSQSIHLPAAPKKANLVVGMIVDNAGNLVDNAIVEITTKDGLPARAIKTNDLGQFYISTPLTKGEYAIEIDKEGLTFPPQSLSVQDKLIAPLLLRAN